MPTPHDRRRSDRPAPGGSRSAFTLVELVVVIVILSILAGLTLSGLAGARQRAKIDKTRSTIRKLHEIVVPIYETYVEKRYTRAVPGNGNAKAVTNATTIAMMRSSVASQQVLARRFMVAADMPDLWDDAFDASGTGGWGSAMQLAAPNARYQQFAAKRFGSGAVPEAQARAFESAECLQMIVVLGGFAADSVEQFRSDEIGDVDKDGAPEFLDGWGRPISFIRWPSGFVSVLQTTTDADPPDPMDPLAVTRSMPSPMVGGNATTDRALVPLIYSGGPNNSLDAVVDQTSGSYGLVSSREALGGGAWQKSGWINPASSAAYDFTTTRWPVSGGFCPGWRKNAREASDNITNHDLVTK